MATSFLTPNMNLVVPVVGQELAPTWASDLNVSLGTIDGHNHSPGSGVQINPSGLNINALLSFNSNPATAMAYVNITPQGGSVAIPVNDSVYVSGVDLYYQDGNGNAVRITSGGSVNATSSGITSGTATASFVSSVLVVDQSTGVGAPIDAATYILRYNGSYPSPSGNYITLAAPSSLSGGYQITFPGAAPASSGAFLTESTAGAVSYTNVDNSTLAISGGVLSVQPGVISSLAANAKSGGKNVLVSNTNATNQLSVIRGTTDGASSITAGEGFTFVNNSTGTYTITFSTSFGDVPVVVVSPDNSSGASTYTATASNITELACIVRTFLNGSITNAAFSFIAIGQV